MNSTEDFPISDLEQRAITELRSQYSALPEQFFVELENLFHLSRKLGKEISNDMNQNIFEGHVVLLGFIRRTHELLLGGVQQAIHSNKYFVASALRGVIENFGAVLWVSEKPLRLPELIRNRGISEGKLTNVAFRRLPGLRDDYKRFSDWIHPSKSSFFVGTEVSDKNGEIAFFSIFSTPFTMEEASATLGAILEGCHSTYLEIAKLIEVHPELATSGKLVATVTGKGRES